MEIKLTEEQYAQLKEDRFLEVDAPNNGIRLYIEYSEKMDVDYFEAYNLERAAKLRRDYALSFDELEKLKPKRTIDPSWNHNYPLCPNCGTYMIYNFENCPKCGQKIDYSEE